MSDWPYNAGSADTGIDLVARRREDAHWTEIQCTFDQPITSLAKGQLDSFSEASGRSFTTEDSTDSFANRLIISTAEKWAADAEALLENQVLPTDRIGPGRSRNPPSPGISPTLVPS